MRWAFAAVGLLGAAAPGFGQGSTPFSFSAGWNRDVVSAGGADSAAAFDTGGAAWYANGARQTTTGTPLTTLPGLASGTTYTSPYTTGGTTRFALQAAGGNNVLAVSRTTGITGVSATGTLTVAGTVSGVRSIAVLAASSNGGGSGTVTVRFSDSTFQAATYSAPDWLASNITQKGLAADVGRNVNVVTGTGGVNSSGDRLTQDGTQLFNLQQTNIALDLVNQGKTITSIQFDAPLTGVAGMSGVFGVSFTPVPEPATVLGAAAAGLGLARLLRRRRGAAWTAARSAAPG